MAPIQYEHLVGYLEVADAVFFNEQLDLIPDAHGVPHAIGVRLAAVPQLIALAEGVLDVAEGTGIRATQRRVDRGIGCAALLAEAMPVMGTVFLHRQLVPHAAGYLLGEVPDILSDSCLDNLLADSVT